jgi:hypothetical protein
MSSSPLRNTRSASARRTKEPRTALGAGVAGAAEFRGRSHANVNLHRHQAQRRALEKRRAAAEGVQQLYERKKKGVVQPGLTVHGLRVSFAAGIKRKRRRAVSNAEVAAALGDRDERMGAHYTRHVENELKVVQALSRHRSGERRKSEPFWKTDGSGRKTCPPRSKNLNRFNELMRSIGKKGGL